MKENIKMIGGILLFFAIIILIKLLLSWGYYLQQQRLDKLAEETRARRLECYERYKTEECFRI